MSPATPHKITGETSLNPKVSLIQVPSSVCLCFCLHAKISVSLHVQTLSKSLTFGKKGLPLPFSGGLHLRATLCTSQLAPIWTIYDPLKNISLLNCYCLLSNLCLQENPKLSITTISYYCTGFVCQLIRKLMVHKSLGIYCQQISNVHNTDVSPHPSNTLQRKTLAFDI